MVKRNPPAADAEPAQQIAGDLSHNLSNSRSGFAADTLLSFVERVERMNEEIAGLTDDRKEIFAEAKATGFDTKIIRWLVSIRKLDLADLQELDALQDLYRTAVEAAENARKKQSLDEAGA